MANFLTRVPSLPPPSLASPWRFFLPLADFYCLILFSRPASGSLATTWVTPATLYLSFALVLFGLPAAIVSLSQGWLGLLLGLLLLFLVPGTLSIAVVGLAQNLSSRR